MHALAVPYVHNPVVQLNKGVPVKLVRQLDEKESRWDFWTSSDAFRPWMPKSFGFTFVPFGETWVLKCGKTLNAGLNWITPFVQKIHAVKTPGPIAMGIVTNDVALSNGQSVNAYAVAHIQVVDFAKSALYRDAETNKLDSESAAARVLRRTLEQQLAKFANSTGELEASSKQQIESALKAALAAKSTEYAIEVLDIDVRGIYETSFNVRDKLRAMDPPVPSDDAAGHNLSADYWADVLTPPFFEKNRYGSNKEIKTRATVSL